MNKFNENNVGNRSLIKGDGVTKCKVCGEETYYIDYCTEKGICSIECYEKDVDDMMIYFKNEEI